MDVMHVRRLLGGQRQASEMPFQFGELRQIRQRLSSGMRAQGPREPIPVLSDARSRRRMLANERGRGLCHEFGTDKPHGGWKPLDQRASEARHIVALMYCESLLGVASS